MSYERWICRVCRHSFGPDGLPLPSPPLPSRSRGDDTSFVTLFLDLCASCRPKSDDETGLALWGGVDLDLDLRHLRQKPCAVCGAPASVAIRRLDEQERTYHCDEHRS